MFVMKKTAKSSDNRKEINFATLPHLFLLLIPLASFSCHPHTLCDYFVVFYVANLFLSTPKVFLATPSLRLVEHWALPHRVAKKRFSQLHTQLDTNISCYIAFV